MFPQMVSLIDTSDGRYVRTSTIAGVRGHPASSLSLSVNASAVSPAVCMSHATSIDVLAFPKAI